MTRFVHRPRLEDGEELHQNATRAAFYAVRSVSHFVLRDLRGGGCWDVRKQPVLGLIEALGQSLCNPQAVAVPILATNAIAGSAGSRDHSSSATIQRRPVEWFATVSYTHLTLPTILRV